MMGKQENGKKSLPYFNQFSDTYKMQVLKRKLNKFERSTQNSEGNDDKGKLQEQQQIVTQDIEEKKV